MPRRLKAVTPYHMLPPRYFRCRFAIDDAIIDADALLHLLMPPFLLLIILLRCRF